MMAPKQISLILAEQGIPVSEDTVLNWIRRGIRVKEKSRTKVIRLDGKRIGGRWFIPREALDQFLRAIAPSYSEPMA